MSQHDPNVSIVELVAHALGDLRSELVLVGGCSVGLLVTDPGRPRIRQTIDVDLVAEVASLGAYYHDLSPKLRACGFAEAGDPMCRWTKGSLIIDVMLTRADIFGHSVNRWYGLAVDHAEKRILPSGLDILVIAAPLFIASKFEAFHGRGHGDYQGSTDMEDIIAVVDGRPELADEVRQSASGVRDFLRDEFDDLLADARFVDSLPGHLPGDPANQARLPLLIERLRGLAGL